jgi:allophanate hydrolase
VVERLVAAGAIPIGKTNLDQFATGLVGVRSPYGVPANSFNPAYIPGGSSSGSAVAVAAGLVSFSLGTDTAGSGRVPAAFNNIVGLKPTRGLLSARGVVPACRSLDCVSIFALTVCDSMVVLQAAASHDPADAYSRKVPIGWQAALTSAPAQFVFGTPRREQLEFFGNHDAQSLFDAAVERLKQMGGRAVEIDFAPFAAAAALLYQPAGTAERTAALGDFLSDHGADMHPVTRPIIERGREASAVDVHRMHYRLQGLRQQTAPVWQQIDILLVPTSPTIYSIKEVEADPIGTNARLGTYTNFVNYLDLSALAVPNGLQSDGLPAGVTLVAPAFGEPLLGAIAQAFHAGTGLKLGATGHSQPTASVGGAKAGQGRTDLVVFGAHLSGEPLNGQLVDLGARLVAACRTAPDYRLYALSGAIARPGLVRVASGGAAIDGEIWSLPSTSVGAFLAQIATPLGIGDVRLSDGRLAKGFVCEAVAAQGAQDITAFGGWRAFRRAKAAG